MRTDKKRKKKIRPKRNRRKRLYMGQVTPAKFVDWVTDRYDFSGAPNRTGDFALLMLIVTDQDWHRNEDYLVKVIEMLDRTLLRGEEFGDPFPAEVAEDIRELRSICLEKLTELQEQQWRLPVAPPARRRPPEPPLEDALEAFRATINSLQLEAIHVGKVTKGWSSGDYVQRNLPEWIASCAGIDNFTVWDFTRDPDTVLALARQRKMVTELRASWAAYREELTAPAAKKVDEERFTPQPARRKTTRAGKRLQAKREEMVWGKPADEDETFDWAKVVAHELEEAQKPSAEQLLYNRENYDTGVAIANRLPLWLDQVPAIQIVPFQHFCHYSYRFINELKDRYDEDELREAFLSAWRKHQEELQQRWVPTPPPLARRSKDKRQEIYDEQAARIARRRKIAESRAGRRSR